MARVLVVEDDASITMLLAFTLGHAGHDVEVCTNGFDALARLDGPPMDAALVDVMLPGDISGLDVVRNLRTRAEWADVPAIIVSALADDKHQWRGWTAGATSYVTKPFETEELLALLERQLDVAARSAADVADVADVDAG